MCEPNFYLPQTLSEIFKTESKVVETEANKSDDANQSQSIEYETGFYRVLPLLSFKNDHQKKVLSLKENEYLRLRWQKYLSKIPSEYIRIRLYTDQKKAPPIPRRMTLNGRFYGIDNKLSPVPIIPDPRMTAKTNFK
ncbi:uncharacterized protein [Eurosta solidaginis]|uniref:uncharacterized protein n=1 Tax=Eurosta solidaginis TaxID=178769 RepID=UPI003530E243